MLEIIIFVIVIACDQTVKAACATWLLSLEGQSYSVIDNVFSFSYVENHGAAFGLLQNAQVFFIVITLIVCAITVYFLIKERKRMDTLLRVTLTLVLAGAVGNFIDRVAFGYVRDMFFFEPINFPVFNVADSAITVGGILLVIDCLFLKGKTYLLELEERDRVASERRRAEKVKKDD